MRSSPVFVMMVTALGLIGALTISAQETPSQWSGVYTALTGDEFSKTWDGGTLGALFEKISITMPRDDPGDLKPQDDADIVAHILRVGKAPAGRRNCRRRSTR